MGDFLTWLCHNSVKDTTMDLQRLAIRLSVLLLTMAVGLSIHRSQSKAEDLPTESLYIGDGGSLGGGGGDSSLAQFSAATGGFLGTVVKSKAGLHGPRGLVLDVDANLLVADQNAVTGTPGDILLYSSTTGKLLQRVVPHSDP